MSRGECIELLSLEVSIVMEHSPNRVQQLSHDGDDGLHWLLPGLDQFLVEGLDAGFEADGHQGRHVQGRSKSAVAGAADARVLVNRGAGVEVTGIDAGVSDPLACGHVPGQRSEFTQGSSFQVSSRALRTSSRRIAAATLK